MRENQSGFSMMGNLMRKSNDETTVEWLNVSGEKGPPKIRFKTLMTTNSNQLKGYITA